jgi:CheY-like chemotaxis protein
MPGNMSRAVNSGMIPPKRILVVDDEPQVADTIRMVLALSGHTIEVADSADKALALYEPGKYDLIISDYSLGKMNGLQMAREIKSRSVNQPIILITAYAESMAMQKELLTDIDFMLGKPFALNQLHEALTTVFAGA